MNPFSFIRFVLIGDFNVDIYNTSQHLYSHLSINLLCSFSLTQFVPAATHVGPNGRHSLIDLALISESSTYYSCDTVSDLGNSDHAGIELLLQGNKKILDQQREPRTVWIYSKADFRKANHLISSTNWNALLYNNVSRSVEYWQEQFLYIMSICIPKRKLT